MSLLHVRDVHTYYGKSHILQGVSLHLEKGEIVSLLGRNGAGKTTTLNTIMGFIKPKSGSITLGDAEIAGRETYRIARMGIAYVPQGRRLFPKMTVFENLKTGMVGKASGDGLDTVFDLFPNLKGRLGQKAWSLSGGEQQALAISRAILKGPQVLLLDEPTTGLMPLFVSSLKGIIKRLNDLGMTILLVEEKVPFALALSDRVYFMVKGKIEHTATRQELEGRKEIFVRYLGIEA